MPDRLSSNRAVGKSRDREKGIVMLLEGVRVVEVAQIIAGPLVGEVFADLGADVIKVERPEGDDARNWVPPVWHGSSPLFHAMNRNKRSVRIDFATAEGKEQLKRLVAGADILVQNLRPGVMRKLGLGPDVMHKVNPRLIYCDIGAYGATGPKKAAPGFEILFQAYTGLMNNTGEPDREPVRLGAPVCDITTGLWTVIGALSALRRRDRTGKGAVIDTSLMESGLALQGAAYTARQATGKAAVRHPTGSTRIAMFQAFRTADGLMMITAATDSLFAKLCDALDRPEWSTDPRFSRSAERNANKDLIGGMVQALLQYRRTREWLALLEPLGVPCAPINELGEAVEDAQVRALGIVQDAPDLDAKFIGLPISVDGVRPAIRHSAPTLGQHDALLDADDPWAPR